jgi:hypothetical protein
MNPQPNWNLKTGILLILMLSSAEASAIPGWLKEISKAPDDSIGMDVEAKVLLDSTEIEISRGGIFTESKKYAVRLLNADGIEEARLRKHYDSEFTKIRTISIWVIKSNGKKVSFGRRDCGEFSPLSELYTEQKLVVFDGDNFVRPGDIFAYEIKSEGKTVFPVRRFRIQRNIPVNHFEVSLKLPPGWTVTDKVLNGDRLVKSVSEGMHSWKAHAIQGVPDDEVLLPNASDYLLHLAITFFPDRNRAKKSKLRTFGNWGEVASYSASILNPPSKPDGAVVEKARLLTRDCNTKWDQAKAVAEYVQSFEYISYSEEMSMGGGHIPHPAPEVLSHGYGDCKNLSTLVRSLLRALEVNSYAVLANNSGDPSRVIEELPCPNWFNHCIVAIQAPPEWESPAIIQHPDLGSLLIFDPTSRVTPFGKIPPSLYGSKILVSSDATRAMTFLEFPAFANTIETSTIASLNSEGSVRADIKSRFHGVQDWEMKRLYNSTSIDEFQKKAAGKLTKRIPGTKVLEVSTNLPESNEPSELVIDLAIESYGQNIGNQFLVFKPILVFRNRHKLPPKERLLPFKIAEEKLVESVEFTIPDDFTPDEMPKDLLLDEPFGMYSGRAQFENGKILVERELVFKEAVYPPEQYSHVRDFFYKIEHFENSTIVLKKTN